VQAALFPTWKQGVGIKDEIKSGMASNQEQGGSSHGGGSAGRGSNAAQRRAPEWADGLKQLYDSVVEEDLPDNFRDLLDRLDQADPAPGHDSASAGNDNGTSPPASGGGDPRP
jgi:hypothetical protein